MAKVGIITMNQIVNYGSALQTYATSVILEKMGHPCIVIDYCYPNEFHCQHGAFMPRLSLKSKVAKFLGIKAFWKQRLLILRFLKSNVRLSRQYKNPESLKIAPPNCDVYVSGSDQIWNPRFNYKDNTYLLDFVPDGKRKISFSSSFSTVNIPADRIDDYKKWLSQYNAISVRERSGVELVKEFTGKDAEWTLDPTLVLDATFWTAFASRTKKSAVNEPYILVYILKYAVDPEKKVGTILRNLCKTKKYKIVLLGTAYDGPYDKKIDVCDLVTFVNLIRNASIVVTSSFHGSAFALNFGIPLIAFYNGKGDDRVSSLLENLGVEHCGYDINSDKYELTPYYDVTEEQSRLQERRVKSIQFLERNLP